VLKYGIRRKLIHHKFDLQTGTVQIDKIFLEHEKLFRNS